MEKKILTYFKTVVLPAVPIFLCMAILTTAFSWVLLAPYFVEKTAEQVLYGDFSKSEMPESSEGMEYTASFQSAVHNYVTDYFVDNDMESYMTEDNVEVIAGTILKHLEQSILVTEEENVILYETIMTELTDIIEQRSLTYNANLKKIVNDLNMYITQSNAVSEVERNELQRLISCVESSANVNITKLEEKFTKIINENKDSSETNLSEVKMLLEETIQMSNEEQTADLQTLEAYVNENVASLGEEILQLSANTDAELQELQTSLQEQIDHYGYLTAEQKREWKAEVARLTSVSEADKKQLVEAIAKTAQENSDALVEALASLYSTADTNITIQDLLDGIDKNATLSLEQKELFTSLISEKYTDATAYADELVYNEILSEIENRNQAIKEAAEELEATFDSKMADLQNVVDKNVSDIAVNTTDINQNQKNIANNATGISENQKSIETNKNSIASIVEQLSVLNSKVDSNKASADSQTADIINLVLGECKLKYEPSDGHFYLIYHEGKADEVRKKADFAQ